MSASGLVSGNEAEGAASERRDRGIRPTRAARTPLALCQRWVAIMGKIVFCNCL